MEREGGVVGAAARPRRARQAHPAAVGEPAAGLPSRGRGARPRDRARSSTRTTSATAPAPPGTPGRSGSCRTRRSPCPTVPAGRDRGRPALRHVRQRQLEQAGAAAARGVRARPAGAAATRGLLLVGATSPGFDLDRRLQRLGLDGGGLVREGFVDETPAVGADAGMRRARQPPLADDGRDVGHGDPRALARQAARSSATSAGSRSSRTTWR